MSKHAWPADNALAEQKKHWPAWPTPNVSHGLRRVKVSELLEPLQGL